MEKDGKNQCKLGQNVIKGIIKVSNVKFYHIKS
jgi:hypothetical protein